MRTPRLARSLAVVATLSTAVAVALTGQGAAQDVAGDSPRAQQLVRTPVIGPVVPVVPDVPRGRAVLPTPAPVPAAPAAPAPVAAPPAPAPAAPSLCSGEGWQQRRGEAALASLRPGAYERSGFRVEFRGARKGYMGLTHLQERRIEVFVRSCDVQSDELLRHVVAHELGHAYDTTRGTGATRAAWLATRGISPRDWYGCSGCTDFATPAGDFAEVYAQWARGASSNRSELAGDVAPAALAALASQFFGA